MSNNKQLRGAKVLLVFLMLFVASSHIFGQAKKITGKVNDKSGPIIGANIVIKGTTTGVVSDLNGDYSLTVMNDDAILVFSFLGYIDQEIAVKGQSNINVILIEDLTALDEVVVIGYGTQKKSDVTGASSHIKSDVIQNLPVLSVDQAIQGRAAGVQVTQNSGMPGSAMMVRIRGTGTTGDASPLYVVDGIAVGNISYLNPNDIASIDILKDASAAGIYGAAAANGVVLITTKNGVAGKGNVEFNMSYGTQEVAKFYELSNAADNQILNMEANRNSDLGKPFGSPYTNSATGLPNLLLTNTNWQKEITRNAPIKNYHVSASGGSDNSSYNLSLGYFNQEGIIMNSGTERFTGRLTATNKVSNHLRVGGNVNVTRSKSKSFSESNEYGPISEAAEMDPATPVLDTSKLNPEYVWASGPMNVINPVRVLSQKKDGTVTSRGIGNIWAEWEIIKDLKVKSILGVDAEITDRRIFQPLVYSRRSDERVYNTTFQHLYGENFSVSSENTLTYSHIFGDIHNITVMAGYSLLHNKGISADISASRMVDDFNMQEFDAVGNKDSILVNGGNTYENRGISYLGRVIYSLKDRYLLTLSIRRDGASVFGRAKQYGNFPSISVGWKVSNEEFMKSIDFISSLKIRGGSGIIGNNKIRPYSFTTLMETSGMVSYSLGGVGADGAHVVGALPSGIANPEVHWEQSVQNNIGFDASFFKNKISLTVDLFNKSTKDMLLPVQIPAIVGQLRDPIQNAAEITNNGIEMELVHRKLEGDFTYEVGANMSVIKNHVVKFGSEGYKRFDGPVKGPGETIKTEAGSSMSSFYGYQVEGIFQNPEQIKNHAFQNAKTAPGDLMFKDMNGDKKIDLSDKTIIGSPLPKFTYGANLSCAYKGFDLSVFIQGTYGNKIYNGIAVLTSNSAFHFNKNMQNRWTPTNPSSKVFRVSSRDLNKNLSTPNSYFVEDGSYMRLKNIQIGYTLPKYIIKYVKIERMRVYVSAQNLLTFTKYSGIEPEIGYSSNWDGSPTAFGVDRGQYPQARVFLGGITVTF